MQLTQTFVIHVPGPLWHPEIDCGKQGKDGAGHQHIVEMSNNKIGVMILEVYRCNRHHQAGKAAD